MTEEKFREIFRQYYRLVMKAAYCVLYDADLSQDICQETFLTFWKRWTLWIQHVLRNGLQFVQEEKP